MSDSTTPPLPAGQHEPLPPGEQPLAVYTAPAPRRTGALVGVGAAVAAALVAGVFALVSVTAGEGTGSPEAAVERMFAAVESEDVLGVLESLPPGERQAIRPGVVELAGELQRLGVLSDDLDLRSVSGVDIEIEGLTLESEPLADGIAAVTITGGTITTSAQPAELPLGPVVRGLLSGDEPEPHSDTQEMASDARIVAISEDGGWHVSLFYSAAEAARQSAGMPLPDFGAGLQPVGSSSPEAVVEDLVATGSALDVRGLIGLVDPREGRALYDYAPLFVDEAERAIAELRAEGPFEIDVTDLDTRVERSGDTARVIVEAYSVGLTFPGEGEPVRMSATWDGECSSVEGMPYQPGPQRTCLADLAELPLDFDELVAGVVVVERDGRWYLSPTRTLLDGLVQVLGIFDRQDLEDPERLLEGLMGIPFAMGGGFGPGMGMVGPGAQEELVFEETGPPIDDEGLVGEGPEDFEAYERCFQPLQELPFDAEQSDYEDAQRQVDQCLSDLDGS